MNVLLTVPHDACPPLQPPKSHLCDTSAKEFAEMISSELKGSKLLISDIHRDSTQLASDGLPGSDQNRPNSRPTDFLNEFKSAITPDTIVLDIHSFPYESTFSQSFHPDIVILDPAAGRDELSKFLTDFLNSKHWKVALVPAASINYIVKYARSINAQASLIEISEAITRATRSQIAKHVSQAVREITAKKWKRI